MLHNNEYLGGRIGVHADKFLAEVRISRENNDITTKCMLTAYSRFDRHVLSRTVAPLSHLPRRFPNSARDDAKSLNLLSIVVSKIVRDEPLRYSLT